MKKKIVFPTLGVLVLASISCSTPQMLIDNNLQANASMYEVDGRQGWLINQHLSFGEFQTGKVNRSWTKGYDFPFIIPFSGVKEKLSFSIRDDGGRSAEIFCLGKLREQDLLLFHKYFDVNIKAKDAFSGSVAIDESTSYDFFVANLNQNNWFREASGGIKGKDLIVSIRPVNQLSNGQKYLGTQVPGFEFIFDESVVGAVETLNKGKIWLHESLTDSQRLVLAGVASALLLRSELADHND